MTLSMDSGELDLPGYDLGTRLFQNDRIQVLEAVRREDGEKFAVATTLAAHSGPESLAKLRAIFALAYKLHSKSIPEFLERIEAGNQLFLLMAPIKGKPLKRVLEERELGRQEKLEIGLALAEVFQELENRDMVLRDIRPENVLYDLESKEVLLLDLTLMAFSGGGISSGLDWAQREGILQYIAPERTGRTNWAEGPWSDLYSFGVFLYELFSGRLPFSSSDPLELIHFHTAGTPIHLGTISSDLPPPLIHLIHRLLSKSPSDRYQTASGLVQDMTFLLENHYSAEVMKHFRIGAFDVPGQARLPDKIFGREEALKQLKECLDRARSGEFSVALLESELGRGKTALAKSFGDLVRGQRLMFLDGGFSMGRMEFRESGAVGAVRKLVRRLLSGEDHHLQSLKGVLESGLGKNLGVLAEAIPEVNLLFGEIEAPVRLDVREEQSRFAFVFRKLLRLLAGPERPLILFLDDFQHADGFSQLLVKEMLVDGGMHHLMLIVSLDGSQSAEAFEKVNPDPVRIELGPLSEVEVLAFFEAAIGPNAKNGRLAEIAYRQTRGIPHLLNQFFLLLRDQGLLRFELAINAWEYDLKEVEGLPIPENIAELIRSRAEALPDEMVRVLGVAAVLGYQFHSVLLAELLAMELTEIQDLLEDAVQSGIVAGYLEPDFEGNPREAKDYSFQHGHIHRHFYEAVPEDIRGQFHGGAFEALWEKYQASEEGHAHDVLYHMGESIEHVGDLEEEKLLQLSVETGQSALVKRSFAQAKACFLAGLALLVNDDAAQHELAFELQLQLARTEFYLGNREAAKAIYKRLLQQGGSLERELLLADDLCQIHILEGRHEDCLDIALKAFDRSNLMKPIPRKAGRIKFEVIKNVIGLRRKFKGAEERMRWLPVSEDRELEMSLSLFRRVVVSSLSVNPQLFALVVLREVQLTLKHGICMYAPSAFLSYSVMHLVGFKDYKGALRIGHLAKGLRKQVGTYSEHWEFEFAYAHFLLQLEKSLRNHLGRYLEIHRALVEKGNPVFAGYSLNSRIWTMGTLGVNLKEIHDEADRYIREFRLRGEQEVLDMMLPKVLAIEALQGKLETPWSIKSEGYDPEEKFQELIARGSKSILGGIILAQLELSWFFRHHERGIAISERGREFLPNMEGIYFASDYYLFTILHHLGHYLETGKRPSGKERKWMAKAAKQFRKLQDMQPENFGSPFLLLDGAVKFLKGDKKGGISQMEAAVYRASQDKFTRNYAMASELCYEMMRKAGISAEDRSQHLVNARQGYLIWGANAKAQSLEDRYPMVLSRSGLLSQNKATGSDGEDALELSSILKAANALSKEIRLSGLLETLVGVLLENAGAQRAIFLLHEQDQLRVEVIGEVREGGFHFESGLGTPQPERMPVGLIQYTARSGETVVVDGDQPGEWSEDPYLVDAKPRSALCHPIFHQGELIGLAYLENKLVSNSFTASRVEILNLLSGQIGISIANARLYENLEAKVKERTRQIESQKQEIELARQKSDQLLLNILPEAVANELKETGRTTARRFEEVTILFSDIVGFTSLAEKLRPEELVRNLDRYFGLCDKVVADLGLEKVKTIGDAYMCAGGLSTWNPKCHVNVVHAALAMLDVAEQLRAEGMEIEIRVGIHTGPVVAGVVGATKFAYDIWGDAVNTAARMETAGQAGRVNVSESTWQLVQADFEGEFRGEVEVKGKGALPMYFVKTPSKD